MSMLVLPHPTATEAFQWGEFTWSTDQSIPMSFVDPPAGWDYNMPIHIGATVSWDPKQLEDFSTATLDLVLVVDCPTTAMRWSSTAPLAGTGSQQSVLVEIPPHNVARTLEVRGWIVSGRGDASIGLPPGSKIAWRESVRLTLEGDGGRFPTEAVSFAARRLPKDAAWRVQLDITDLDDTFGSSVRVLVNKDHPVSNVLLDQSNPLAPMTTEVLRRDIISTVLRHLATSDEGDLASYDHALSDSLGSVVNGWCESYLLQDLASATAQVSREPTLFDTQLQSGLRFLKAALK